MIAFLAPVAGIWGKEESIKLFKTLYQCINDVLENIMCHIKHQALVSIMVLGKCAILNK